MMKLIHGGDIYSAAKQTGLAKEDLLDFSANLNPLGMAPGVKKAIVDQIESCTCYPDPLCRELTEALSRYHELPGETILCGNGAADVIFRLIYAKRPKRALVLAPTFAEYAIAMEAIETEVVEYLLEEAGGFEVTKDILEVIDESLDMLFICNPNNPTGKVVPLELMTEILEKCKETGTLLVVDECFNEFLEDEEAYSLMHLIEENPQLFILKAFTKMYAIAGLRLGYGLTSNQDLMEKMYQCAQAWSVSSIAQIAGVAALKEEAYVRETKKLIKEQRDYLQKALKTLGMKVYGSKANYIFFRCPLKIDLREKTKAYGILIRSCDNYTGLDNSFYRIAVKSEKDNRRLIACLEQIMK
ncbi:MAG: threonine-phosphate decarboxylase CobD [Cellulosilyticaceae bacterium]